MGYNSVAVILNDATGSIRHDPGFGERVADAVTRFSARNRSLGSNEANAVSNRGIHIGALTIVGQEHADFYQVVVVGHNSGWAMHRDDNVPEDAVNALARELKRRGWKVTAPK
jgi:hypothetical protein